MYFGHNHPYVIMAIILLQFIGNILLAMAIAGGNNERSLIDSNDIDQQYSDPSNQLQRSYDEYPMVVPKRAALLLDRLMVALHHALEERNGNRRISELYSTNNQKDADGGSKVPKFSLKESINDYDQGENYDAYDDVPSDIDFRDLSSLNRATGKTRSLHGIDGVGGVGGSGGGGGSGGFVESRSRNINNSGGTWKKCYLNVISCF